MKMKKRRLNASVNAGSMADIAFLLLIFFLVATQIANDRGIPIILPEYYEGPPAPEAENNVLSILINAEDELLIEGKLAEKETIKSRVMAFVQNKEKLSNRPSNPKKAIVFIKNHESTSYEMYVDVYSNIQAAYKQMRNEQALKYFQKSFDQLDRIDKKGIADALPMKISEADPF